MSKMYGPGRMIFGVVFVAALMGCKPGGDDDDTSTTPPEATPTQSPSVVPTEVSSPTPPLSTPVSLPADGCRVDADCTPANDAAGEPSYCVGPDEDPGMDYCGSYPGDQCYSDEECGDPNLICEPTGWQDMGGCYVGSYNDCRPGCDPLDASTCAFDQQCNPDTLRCDTVSCIDGGFTCPDLHTCVAGSGGNDCQRVQCGTVGSISAGDSPSCGAGNVCLSDGLCYVSGCEQSPNPCAGPEFIGCVNLPLDGGYECLRQVCSVDQDCGFDGAICVEGQCSSSFGYCDEDVAYP